MNTHESLVFRSEYCAGDYNEELVLVAGEFGLVLENTSVVIPWEWIDSARLLLSSGRSLG
jgi:hypothetical protein